MSRLLIEDYGRLRRRGAPAGSGDDQAEEVRSTRSLDGEPHVSCLYRERKDPSGRRSLTGLEFRRQRSIQS
jgi:hypothetical protein